MSYDLSGQKVELQDSTITMSKMALLQAIMSNVSLLADKHNGLTTETENAVNDLQSQLDDISGASQEDIDKINDTIKLINDLLSEDSDGANIIGALVTLYSEMNRREETKTQEVVIDTDNGKVNVDLTSFGFGSVDDYSLQVSFYGDKPLTPSVTKVDEKTATIIITDGTKWEFNDDRFFDGTDESVTAVLTVSRLPIQLHKTLTEVDGDTDTL